jgi:chromosome segregation ATPase
MGREMNTEQITQVANEDEKRFAEISGRITDLNVSIEEAQENLNRYIFDNPLRVNTVRERILQLQAELESLQSQRQRLLPLFADLKSRINGW